MLRLGRQSENNITFTNPTDRLNLELGGLLRENNAFSASIGTTAVRGVLTAGGTEDSGARELVIFTNTAGGPTFYAPNTTGVITSGSPLVTLSSTIGLQPGMNIAHANFPAGTTVLSVNSLTQVTLSNNATGSTQNTSLTTATFRAGVTASGSAQVSMNTTLGIAPGMTLTGTGIPAGTYVVSVDSATQVTLSQNASANATGLDFTLGLGNLIVNSVIADNGDGNSVSLIKSGAGVLNLTANNTYTGGTVVNQGTLNLMGTGVVIPGDLTINGGTTGSGALVMMNTNGGQIAASSNVTLNGRSTLTLAGTANTLNSLSFNNYGGEAAPTVNVGSGSTLTLAGANAVTVTSQNVPHVAVISGGTLALTTGAKTFDVDAVKLFGEEYLETAVSLNITSLITGAGASIEKTGDGILQLSNGSNNYGGSTTITEGTLQLGAAAIPASSALIVGAAGTFNMNSFSETVGSLAGEGIVTNRHSTGVTLTIGANNTNTSFTGTILQTSGSMSLTKTGTGTQTLGGANNYSGATLVNAGILSVSHNNALGTTGGTTTVAGGASLELQNNVTLAESVSINGTGAGGTGALRNLSGNNTYSGTLTMAGAATITSDADNLTLSGADITGANALTFDGAGQTTVARNIATTAAVIKNGVGIAELQGANTYTGATTVNNGTLLLSGSLSGTSSVNVNGGGTLSGTGSVTTAAAGNTTVFSGGTLAPGAGLESLTLNTLTSTTLDLQLGSTFQLSIANSNSGSGAAALQDYSKLSLGTGVSTTLNGDISTVISGGVSEGDLFTIIINSGAALTTYFNNTTPVIGTASTYAFSSGGQDWMINFEYTGLMTGSGIDREDFQNISGGANVALLAVPEPNALSMLAGSLGLALGLQRFRRRKTV
jgi:autotransporter-associated beta strand protein